MRGKFGPDFGFWFEGRRIGEHLNVIEISLLLLNSISKKVLNLMISKTEAKLISEFII